MTTGTTFIRSHAARQAPPALVLPDDVRWMRNTANLLFAVAGLLLVGIVLLWFTRQPVFALGSIRIEGDMARNSVATIRVNAVPKLRGNFFSTDLKADQRAFESVPWVRRAVVQRVWPNRLLVRLEEHRPVAVWSRPDSDDRLVNAQGEVFQANVGDVEDDALPVLEGPEGSSQAILAMLTRLQPLFARLDWRVEALPEDMYASGGGRQAAPDARNAAISSPDIPSSSASTLSVCSPRSGAGSMRGLVKPLIRGRLAGIFNAPMTGCSTVAIISRAA
jgi:cell division protein FtsQ